MGDLDKPGDDAGHVEYFQRAREDCQRLGVLGLARVALDKAKAQATAGAFVGKEQAHGAGAHDQGIGVDKGVRHGQVSAVQGCCACGAHSSTLPMPESLRNWPIASTAPSVG